MPAINTETGDTVAVTGLLISAGTVTNGAGTETSIAIDVTDADIVTALSVGANTVTGTTYTLEATTALTLGDALTGTNATSNDWEINTAGDMTGIGAITSDGAITTTSTFDVDGAANISDTTAGADVTMGNSTGNLTFLSDNADFTLTDGIDNVFQLVNATNSRLYLDIDAGATDTVTLGNTTDVTAINGAASTIDFTDFDVSADGLVILAPDSGLDADLNYMDVQTPAITATAATTIDVYGISSSGLLQTTDDVSNEALTWRGINLAIPAITHHADAGADDADTILVTGLLITAGTVTAGDGVTTSIAIDVTDADIVTALSVGANTVTGTTYTLEATTALTLGDALTGTNATLGD